MTKKRNVFLIILLILLIIVVGIFTAYFVFIHNTKSYRYKINYFYGAECEMYLYYNDEIKTVCHIPEVSNCEGTDCLTETGGYVLEEKTINFSKANKKKAINLIKDLHKMAGKKEFNIADYKLNSNQEKIYDAIISNDESMIK